MSIFYVSVRYTDRKTLIVQTSGYQMKDDTGQTLDEFADSHREEWITIHGANLELNEITITEADKPIDQARRIQKGGLL